MHARTLGVLAGACLFALPASANADFAHVVSPGDTLTSVAAQDGITLAALAAANGISPDTQLVAGTILQIPPRGAAATTTASTGSTGTTGAASRGSTGGGGSYVVAPGDTLSGIAAQAGTTVAALAAANGLDPSDVLLAGTVLTLTGGSTGSQSSHTEYVSSTSESTSSGSTSGGGSYVVQPGDTLTGIAARAGMTVAALAAANGLDPSDVLLTGTVLSLSGGSTGSQNSHTEYASSSSGSTGGGGSYVVQPGDTLSGIAARAGTTVAALAAANGLNPTEVLLAGTVLTLTGGSNGSQTGYSEEVSSTAGNTSGPYPTNEYVTGSEIAGIAGSEGVSAPLAEAIGWQESGWSNDVVSSVGAVGVMQIVPTTWQWIEGHLTSVPLNPSSAADNVRAGSLLLGALMSQTGGSYSESAAGYYQGLASVRQNGMYSDTKQYVANVLALMAHFGG